MSSVIQLLQAEEQYVHISASALRTLDGCPRKWWYKYVTGEPPEDVPANLVRGIAVHRALASFYTALQNGEVLSVEDLCETARCAIETAAAKGPPLLFSKGESLETVVAETRRVLAAFMEEGYRPAKVIGVEHPFMLELHHPETGEAFGFEEPLVGSFDLVTEDDEGRLVVTDHKVSARLDRKRAERPDLQMGLYAWAAKKLFGAKDVVLQYQSLIRTKTARVELQGIGRVAHDEAEAVEAAVSGLDLIHLAITRPNGRRLLGRRRSWACSDCGWRGRCGSDRG